MISFFNSTVPAVFLTGFGYNPYSDLVLLQKITTYDTWFSYRKVTEYDIDFFKNSPIIYLHKRTHGSYHGIDRRASLTLNITLFTFIYNYLSCQRDYFDYINFGGGIY